MRYALVATTGYLLLVDLQSRQVTPLENERPEYYGISWFPNGMDIVLSHSGLKNEELVDLASYAQSEQGWLSVGPWSSRKILSAPHQILCAPDGRIICTNTGRNVITVIDPAQPTCYQEAGISEARWDRLGLDQAPGDHLNSIFLRGDRLYVIAHGHRKGSILGTFSYPDLDLISVRHLRNKQMLHNIWVTGDGQWISCDSGAGALIDLEADATLWEAGTSIYTRGLAAGSDHVIVGESQKLGRDLRRSSLSSLWILDRKGWNAVDYLCLGPYGAVNEVRLLDVPDEAHHGIPFRGLENLLQAGLYERVAESKRQAEQIARTGRQAWSAYDVIFGNPDWQADGSKAAAAGHLCLTLKRPRPDNGTLAFSYVLHAGQESHVSAVLGYAGNWDDTRMAALLLQPDGKAATLSVWRQDGQAWAPLPGVVVRGLPLTGAMRLHISDAKVSLAVDRKKVLTLSAAELGLTRCDEGLGIRWTGSSVRPLEAGE